MSGPSVRRLSFVMVRLFAVALIVLVVFGVLFFSLRHALDGLPLALMISAVVVAVAAIWLVGALVLVQRRRETAAGYTSVPNVLPGLPTVDYKTGRVLREAGEHPISSEEYERRQAQVADE